MLHKDIVSWLMEADVSIQYLVKRDLLDEDDQQLQKEISTSGWGSMLLSQQNDDGHWGLGYYRPKWSCTHYTLLELKEMALPRGLSGINSIIHRMLSEQKAMDGGITFWKGYLHSDICVDAMVLNYTSYFLGPVIELNSVVDLILKAHMPDGGWNCRWLHKAVHSSFHTTLSVLEGISEYLIQGGDYRVNELETARRHGIEFLLTHHFYKSHQTMEPVDPKMMLFSYPPRWRYDVLRSMYYMAKTGCAWDDRMSSAIQLLLHKRNADGSWNLNNRHAGKEFFHMEKTGKPSRWNTYRALRVLKHYQIYRED